MNQKGNSFIWVLIIIVVILIGILIWGGNRVNPELQNDEIEEESEESVSTIEIQMQPKGDIEVAQSGSVRITEVAEGQSRVRITLDNFAEKTDQPAHVHEGDCTNPGSVVFPLESIREGNSITAVNAGLSDLVNGNYVIQAHLSEDDHAVTSCGEIISNTN